MVVFGGDGTLLRGAELARPTSTPVLGVNLGHVGFLAEAERDALDATVDRVVARAYTVEERLTVDVTVTTDGDVVHRGWALNEASIEKASRRADARGRRRDRRPPAVPLGLRRGGDGHADRLDGVRVLRRRPGGLARGRGAAAGADQRARAVRPAAGGVAGLGARRRGALDRPERRACCGATGAARSTCRRERGSRPAGASARCCWPGCTRRRSPTGWWRSSTCRCWGWRGRPGAHGFRPTPRVGSPACSRRCGSGASASSRTPCSSSRPGLTVVSGETGAGKTMVVTGLGLLFGGRADPGAVRPGVENASVEGRLRVDPDGPGGGPRRGGRRRAGRRRARRRPHRVGGRPVPRPPRRPQRARRRPRRAGRLLRGGARPERPVPAAAAGPPARRARPLRRRRGGRAAGRLPRGVRRAAQPSAPSSTS